MNGRKETMIMEQVGNESSASTGADEAYSKVKEGKAYPFMRDYLASTRLTGLHCLWKDTAGFLIHPEIPTNRADLKIADVATGNGIWLYDVASKLPQTCEFYGFDISLDQIGPKPWLPLNIHMHTWNVFEEPPSQFRSFFDIIHVRLLTLVVKNENVRLAVENLTKMLKPGGYLQWEEIDSQHRCRVETVPDVSGEHLRTILEQFTVNAEWKGSLGRIMDENGYSGTSLHIYEPGLNRARLFSDIYFSTWKELTTNVSENSEISREAERKAMEEVRNGAAMICPQIVWVGKKV